MCFAGLAELLRFSGLAEAHGFTESGFKRSPFDHAREFRQICRIVPHDHLDSANSGPLGGRFIYGLNRGGEHPTSLSIWICFARALARVAMSIRSVPFSKFALILSVSAEAGRVNDREKEPYSRSTRRKFSFLSSASNLRSPLTVSRLPSREYPSPCCLPRGCPI